MWLFWPMVFAVLGFGSVAYSEEDDTFPVRLINGKALNGGFSVNLEEKDLKPDETPDSETDGSGDETGEEQPDKKPVSGDDKPDSTPRLEIIGGFNAATGSLGAGTRHATETGVPPQQILEEGFDAATGTLGPGLPSRIPSGNPRTLRDAIRCYDKFPEPKTTYHDGSWIFHNYVPMSAKVHCWQSVTYVTHTRWFDLIHIAPLVERWRGPISVAVEANDNDFEKVLDSIRFLKSCSSPLVSQYVTFHIYFMDSSIPDDILKGQEILSMPYDCGQASPLEHTSEARADSTYSFYHPNLGRNIARENALTHYHIVANIDLYPSANLASDFLEMIRRDDQPETSTPNPKVFVLPPFEVVEGETIPFNKTELMKMLKEGKVVQFPDTGRCPLCQNMPEAAAWRSSPETDALGVFFVGKRTGPFKSWEPIFIGTDKDPVYYQRFSEETTHDRRIQGWLLCQLDYDFLILDNAFVVRPPGIEDIEIYSKGLRADMDGVYTDEVLGWYRKLYGEENRQCAV